MKNMKKLISATLTIMLFLGVFGVTSSFASEEMIIYDHIDISSSATGKFWVNTADTNEMTKANYSQTGWTDRHYDTDFFVDRYLWEVVVKWPLEFDSTRPGESTITGADAINPIITSKNGITYKMPPKTSAFNNGKESINILSPNEVKIPIGKKYDRIYFLTADAYDSSNRENPKKSMTVKIKYKDEDAVATEITNEPVLGRNTYASEENFVAVLKTRGARNTDARFNTDNGSSMVALYEYSIDVDSTKELESINVTVTWLHDGNKTTFCIPSITGMRDWTEEVVYADEAILTASDDITNVEKVLEAVTVVNELKKVGLEVYLQNLELYNQLFSDSSFSENLIEGIYPEGNTVEWEDADVRLEQIKSIIEAIGYDAFSDLAKQKLDTAFYNMVNDLIESEESDEVKKERFLLLKNAGISRLTDVLYEEVMWVESYSDDKDFEWIYFNLEFSQSIDEEKLNEEYFIVRCGDEIVDSTFIKYDKTEDKNLKVKVLNTLNYTKAYTLEISKEFIGENGGEWISKDIYAATTTAPMIFNDDAITVSEETVSGTFKITNNLKSEQSFILTIAFYDDKDKMIQAQHYSGTVLSGKTYTSDATFNYSIPSGTKEIICYLMDSYTNGNLLTNLCKLK